MQNVSLTHLLREQWAVLTSLGVDQPTPNHKYSGGQWLPLTSLLIQTHNLQVSGGNSTETELRTQDPFLFFSSFNSFHSVVWCDSIASTIHMQYCPLLFMLYCWRRHILTLGIQVTFTAASDQHVHTFFYRPFKSSLLICAGCNLFVMGTSRWHAHFRRVPLYMSTSMSNVQNKKEGRKEDHGSNPCTTFRVWG